MAIPTGYEKLAAIGIAYKGDYAEGTAYKLLNAVYYNGATYVALKDDPVTPPVADGINWQYLAKGFTDGVLSAIEAIDTSGLIGQAGATVGAQPLLDVIADKVATKLLAKNQVVNNLLATIPGNALDACQGKALMDLINQQNSDIKWKLSGTYLATQTGQLPEIFSELLIKVFRTSDRAYTCSAHILPDEIEKNTSNWMMGAGRDQNGYDIKVVVTIKDVISVSSVHVNAGEQKLNYSYAVYYR